MDHTIVHFEIPANDIEKLKKFYMNLFGWTMNKYPGPNVYYLVGTVPVDEKTMMPVRQVSTADYTIGRTLQCQSWLSR